MSEKAIEVEELTIIDKIEALKNKGDFLGKILNVTSLGTIIMSVLLLITAFMFSTLPEELSSNIVVQNQNKLVESGDISWNDVLIHLQGIDEPISMAGVIDKLPALEALNEDINAFASVTSEINDAFAKFTDSNITKIFSALLLMSALAVGIMKQDFVRGISLFMMCIFVSYAGDIVKTFTGTSGTQTTFKYKPLPIELVFIATQELYLKKDENKDELTKIWNILKDEPIVLKTLISSTTNDRLYLIDKYLHEGVTLPLNITLEKKVISDNKKLEDTQQWLLLLIVMSTTLLIILFLLKKDILSRVKRIKGILSIEDAEPANEAIKSSDTKGNKQESDVRILGDLSEFLD